MRKITGILFVIIAVGLGVALGLTWKTKPSGKTNSSVRGARPSNPTSSLMQVAKESVGRPPSEVPATDEPCVAFLEYIETTPLNTVMIDIKDKKILIPVNCESRVGALKPLWDKVISTCKSTEAGECEASMLVFRAARLTDFYKNIELSAQPFEAVVQKLFSLLGQNQVTNQKGLLEFRAVAQELLNRDPASRGASKAEVLSFMIEKAMSTDGTPGMDPWDQEKDANFGESLARARELNPEDQQVYEIELLNDLFPVTAEKFAEVEQSAQSQPNDALLNYISACAAWKMQQIDRARYYFQKAASLSSNDARFLDSWQKSQTATPGSAICTFQAGFDPNSF